jgi:hypothetical protein
MTDSLSVLIRRRVGAAKRAVLPYLILPLIAAASASASAGPPAATYVPNEIIAKFRSPAADALEQQHSGVPKSPRLHN